MPDHLNVASSGLHDHLVTPEDDIPSKQLLCYGLYTDQKIRHKIPVQERSEVAELLQHIQPAGLPTGMPPITASVLSNK